MKTGAILTRLLVSYRFQITASEPAGRIPLTFFYDGEQAHKKSMMLTHIYGVYRFGSCIRLTDRQLQQLTTLLDRQPQSSPSHLNGRHVMPIDCVDGIGAVVVKHYIRGGLFGCFVKRRHLKSGKTRGQAEYEVLQKVRALGINAPEPVAFAFRGGLVYLAWLITLEIKRAQSLARLSLENEHHARAAMQSASRQIGRLIDSRIWHVDLHPGNVLVDQDNTAYLVDFDKGRDFHGSRKKLQARYLSRWQRAVQKHRLPVMLTEMLQQGLDIQMKSSKGKATA
jgi:3-deoxy-D-manno-octulosonic acid kinase